MGRKYAIRDQQAMHFVTFSVVNWIDLFIRDDYKKVLVDSLNHCVDNKGLIVYAYCFMTSHIHLIIQAKHEFKLSNIIRDFKSYTASVLRKTIEGNSRESRREWLIWMFKRAGKKNSRNTDFQLWQQHNHPIDLIDNRRMEQRLDYIHFNPVEAGFVDDPKAWIWSSCNEYETGQIGLVKIEMIH